LAFPAPSSVLPVTWRTLEGAPTRLVGPVSFAASDLLFFVSPRRELRLPLLEIVLHIGVDDDIAAVTCLAAQTFRPSIDMLSGVDSRADVSIDASILGLPGLGYVPTAWFCTTSPAYSTVCLLRGSSSCSHRKERVVGLLHPTADPGVRRILSFGSVAPAPWYRPFGRCHCRTSIPNVPCDAFLPSKDAPRSQLFGVSTAGTVSFLRLGFCSALGSVP
jgi:hypothetical protein